MLGAIGMAIAGFLLNDVNVDIVDDDACWGGVGVGVGCVILSMRILFSSRG